MTFAKGNTPANAVMTEDDVREIVRLRKEHGWGATRISKETGHPHSTVRNVLRGRHWGRITGGPLIAGRKPYVRGSKR